MKYSKEIAEAIAEQYGTGNQSVDAICQAAKISRITFYRWQDQHPEFAEMISGANEGRMKSLGEMAISGLALRLTVYEYDEVTTEYAVNTKGVRRVKSQRITTKRVLPHPETCQYVANNRLPADWKNASHINFVEQVEKDIDRMTEQQLDKVIEKLLEKA